MLRLHRATFLSTVLTIGASLSSVPSLRSAPQTQAVTGLTQYTFGTPSGDETEMLAEINRARSNPTAEGQRLAATLNPANYGIEQSEYQADVNELLTDFPTYQVRPPLAFNADLNASAQAHTADMVKTEVLTHNSSNGQTYLQRVISFGYTEPSGENCDGAAKDSASYTPWEIEADYELDFSVPGYGHRMNVMEPVINGTVEIGIGQHALGGWNTEDFGGDRTVTLLSGTVFTDDAGTGFYVSGEGVASVVVTAPGASSYYAVTVKSGAYTLPLDLLAPYNASVVNPTVQVVFTDALGNATTQTVALSHTVDAYGSTYINPQGQFRYDNAKADLIVPAVGGFPAFFDGQAALDNGVYYLAFPNGNYFGYYSFLSDPNYLYHFDLGYEYLFDAQDGRGGLYLYDFLSGDFFYTSPTFPFPYLYDFALESTVYYYPDPANAGHYNTDGVRYFYVFSTGKIISK